MTNQTMNAMRMILLVAMGLVLAITAFLYFRKGEFDYTGFVIALGCLFVFIITKPRTSPKRD